MLLAIHRHDTFPAVVALSPDSDFATTHKPFTEEPGVRAVTPADLDAAMGPADSYSATGRRAGPTAHGALGELHPHRRKARTL